ncbi:type I secretion system permease/ATPase [Alteromonas sp. 14N.309.X.WAT.G.H12]|uniref:type I secretion system permease/ATPase n=1 Tax=Alteromonas sp. 14N.309.X.WAT.G.H12 TaxID=3120824 RepID=UPI002FD4DFE4
MTDSPMDETSHHHGGVLMDCLSVICKYHKISMSRDSILAGLPMKNGTLSPSALGRAAIRLGLTSKTTKRELSQINLALLPAILILKNEKACILHSYNADIQTVEVVFPDSSDAVESLDVSEFEAEYTQYVIFVRPTHRAHHKQHIATQIDKNNWFWGVIKDVSPLYKDVIVASVFISLLSVALPLFVMNVYDRVVPNAAIETLWVLVVGVLLALMADFFLRMLRHFFVELAASRIDVTLSSALLQQVLGFKLKERPKSSGAFVNRIQSFDAIKGFLNSVTLVSVVDLPFALLFLVIICFVDMYLAIPILLGGTLLILYGLYVQKTLESLSNAMSEITATKHGLLTEAMNAFEDVKFTGVQHHLQFEWEKQSIYLAKTNAKLRLAATSVSNLALYVQQSVGVVIILIGVYLIIDGQITQGGLIAAYLLSSRAMGPLSMAASILAQYHQAKTALSNLDDLMSREQDINADKKWTVHQPFSKEIEFKQVSFSYPEQRVAALSQLSLTIKAGEHVAILGKNGSGKTSINTLLMKGYSVTRGLLTIDGIDIEQYEPMALRKGIGYMPQQFNLLSGTLKENITAFDDEIDEAIIWEIIEACGMTDFVNNHPDGLNMQIGENGQFLSGGRRQAVALARAMVRNPSIYLLDEPTSAMDSATEKQVCGLIKAKVANKTLLLVTHRQALLSLVDRIIVIDKGRCIADGARDEILAKLTTLASRQEPAKQRA